MQVPITRSQQASMNQFAVSLCEIIVPEFVRQLTAYLKNQEAVQVASTQAHPDTSNNDDDEILTREEAMAFLKVGSTKFNELRNENDMEPIMLGTKTNYLKSDLLKLAKSLQSKKVKIVNESEKKRNEQRR